jgi:hypothetical protein
MEAIAELITSYETRISTVEELIATTYQTTVASQGTIGVCEEERQRLIGNLQEISARNCSLRKKDFTRLMQDVLREADGDKNAIAEERGLLRQEVDHYLDEQKALASRMREKLSGVATGAKREEDLRSVLEQIRESCRVAGERILPLLREHQERLSVFQREQGEINRRLQTLVDAGTSLKIEDLRQLEAIRDRQARKNERGAPREEVEIMLAGFGQKRRGFREKVLKA